jgi:hypothetical protein
LTQGEAKAVIAYIRALEEEAGLTKHVRLTQEQKRINERLESYWSYALKSALAKIHEAGGREDETSSPD